MEPSSYLEDWWLHIVRGRAVPRQHPEAPSCSASSHIRVSSEGKPSPHWLVGTTHLAMHTCINPTPSGSPSLFKVKKSKIKTPCHFRSRGVLSLAWKKSSTIKHTSGMKHVMPCIPSTSEMSKLLWLLGEQSFVKHCILTGSFIQNHKRLIYISTSRFVRARMHVCVVLEDELRASGLQGKCSIT